MLLPCIVCCREVETHDDNYPYKATVFYSKGNYGSTFFDPMDGSTLEINICDYCLKASSRYLKYNDPPKA